MTRAASLGHARARRRVRAPLVSLLMFGLLLAVPGAAAAPTPQDGSPGTITLFRSDSPSLLQVAFSAREGPDGRSLPLTADSLQVSLGPADSDEMQVLSRLDDSRLGAATTPQVMLVLDTSGTMDRTVAGTSRIERMKTAAAAFLAQLPDADVGLVTFADPAVLLSPVGTEHSTLRRQIAGLRAGGDTALFQALSLAAKALPTDGSRRIVLLTDGENDQRSRPRVTRDQATRALLAESDTAPIALDAVMIDSNARGDLAAIAARLSDEQVPAQVIDRTDVDTTQGLQQLLSTFRRSAQDLGNEVSGRFTLPAELAGRQVSAVVSATSTDGRRFQATWVGELAAAAPPSNAPGSAALPAVSPPLILGSGVAAAAMAVLFVVMVLLLQRGGEAALGGRNSPGHVVRRLEMYTVAGRTPDRVAVREEEISTTLGDNPLTRRAVSLMGRIARHHQLDRALDERLDAAGLPWRTAEWMVVHIAVAVLSALVMLVMGGGGAAATVLGLVLGLLGPWVFLVLGAGRRERKFLAQLPDTLHLLAGSLAAGYSLPQAMDTVVRESQAPIRVEFNRALVEARLGMLPEEALEGIARRTASEDFAWIVLAIRIQRDVGGNLAELLISVAATLRERERLRRQVSALSAEGKLSGIILGALPVVFAAYLLLTQPEYLAPLWQTPLGWLLMGTGVTMLLVGAFWMSRLVRVEV